MPGDTVEIKNNVLYINNKVYEENYLKPNMNYKDFKLSELNYNKIPNVPILNILPSSILLL